MYINPFVTGVIATIMVELIIVIGMGQFRDGDKKVELKGSKG